MTAGRSYAAAAGRASALLPPVFFAPAVVAFAAALLAAPFLSGEVVAYFYQARVLALTHLLTLGWVSMTILGVLYRYVPGLTKQSLPAPALAVMQWATFVVGVTGLVIAFWLGAWPAATLAAMLLVVSALLLCANLWPLVWRSGHWGVAEVGVVLATGFLVVAATLGATLAADKLRPLIGGSLLSNLGAHVHLAALGWVGTTIMALSVRFLPAFLLPTEDVTGPTRRVVVAFAVAIVALATALLARSALVWPAALAVVAILAAYVMLARRVVASRRLPIDWTARHGIASLGWCAIAALLGLALLAVGAGEEGGARLAPAYGVAGLLGWMSNLIVGMSYKLFPGFVAAARAARGRPAVPVATLGVRGAVQPAVFACLNAGTLAVVVGLVAALPVLVLGGSVALAATGLGYALASVRTLAFVVLDPGRPAGPLVVLP